MALYQRVADWLVLVNAPYDVFMVNAKIEFVNGQNIQSGGDKSGG